MRNLLISLFVCGLTYFAPGALAVDGPEKAKSENSVQLETLDILKVEIASIEAESKGDNHTPAINLKLSYAGSGRGPADHFGRHYRQVNTSEKGITKFRLDYYEAFLPKKGPRHLTNIEGDLEYVWYPQAPNERQKIERLQLLYIPVAPKQGVRGYAIIETQVNVGKNGKTSLSDVTLKYQPIKED